MAGLIGQIIFCGGAGLFASALAKDLKFAALIGAVCGAALAYLHISLAQQQGVSGGFFVPALSIVLTVAFAVGFRWFRAAAVKMARNNTPSRH